MDAIVIVIGTAIQWIFAVPFFLIGFIAGHIVNYVVVGWNTFYGLHYDDFGSDENE